MNDRKWSITRNNSIYFEFVMACFKQMAERQVQSAKEFFE